MGSDDENLANVAAMLTALPQGHRRVWVNARAWQHGFETLPDVNINFDALRGGITRDEMIRIVDLAIAQNRAIDGFVVCMVWGYGPSGYGPYRTRRVLEQAEPGHGVGSAADGVVAALADGAEVVRAESSLSDKARRGFWFFNNREADAVTGTPGGNLKYLGHAFFTKWISAASAHGVPENLTALPILDGVIAGWWQANVDPGFNPKRTADYVTYVEQLQRWRDALGNPAEVSLMRIEESIFEFVQRGPGASTPAVEIEGVLR